MNVLAYAVSRGNSHLWMLGLAVVLCSVNGANSLQVETAIEHGENVAAGVDYPNWKD